MQQLSLPGVVDPVVALSVHMHRQLNEFVTKLFLQTPESSEKVREFLSRLLTRPFTLAPEVIGLECRVREALFWRDCKSVRRVYACDSSPLLPHGFRRLDTDFVDADGWPFHRFGAEFWDRLAPLVEDPFLQQLDGQLRNDFSATIPQAGIETLVLVIAAFVDIAVGSHFDSVLLQQGERCHSLFALYFDGNPILGYQMERHEAVVLLASRPVN